MLPDAECRVDGEFDLSAIFAPYRRSTFGDPTSRQVGETWWRAARTPEGPVTVGAAAVPGAIRLCAFGPGAGHALARAEALLGVDDDPCGFRPDHPLLVEALRRRPELRFGRTFEIVDTLVPTILGQRVTGRAATESYRALVYRYGDPAPGPVPGLRLPPDASRLCEEPYYRLHPHGVERTRAQVLIEVCRRRNRLEALGTAPLAVAAERLGNMRGIGPWTVAHVLTASHGDADAVPLNDVHLPNAVAWALAGEPRADDARMTELLAPYAGHRARVIRLVRKYGTSPPKYGPRAEVPEIRDL